jgi:thiol-disulfide isomerase/thioredoxin
MSTRRGNLAVLAIAFCALGQMGGAAQQSAYPAAKPGDPGYIAEDPQLAARLVGQPGPAITLRTMNGGTIDLAREYGRKPVYFKLWATYCLPCRAQMPGFEKIYEEYRGRMDIVAVDAGVGDDAAKVRAFVTASKLRMPVAIDDGSLGAWLKMEATPFHVVIGRDGRIAYAGHQDGPPLETALAQVLVASAPRDSIDKAAVARVAALKPGDRVPAIDLVGPNNAPVRFAAGPTDRPRAILFTAVWCEDYLKDTEPTTVAACKRTRELVDELAGTNGVDWLGVVAHLWTTPRSLVSYETRMKPRVPMAIDSDGQAFRVFGVGRLPAVALIAADGRLVRLVGPDDTDLRAAVEKLTRP